VKRLAVLVSGRGTNLQAIIDATESGALPNTCVSVVVSNRKAAYALKRTEAHGIPTNLVVLAGWMHVFTMAFLQHYPGRVLNIHPALPGVFPGPHAIERAYEAFRRGEIDHTGVMVHRVPDEGVDAGPVVVMREVPIYSTDSLDDLEARIHAVEHEIYVQAIAITLETMPD